MDQIRYEGENTGFDFKAIAYKLEKAEDLLKDLMAMANIETEDSYLIKTHLGDLQHNRTTPALKTPARVALPVHSASQQLEVTLTLFGKNLPRPYVKSLLIAIV